MNITFANKNVTVVVSPFDLRAGYGKLTSFVRDGLGIDITKGDDIVLFFNSEASLCKIVTADDSGSLLLSRRLHRGRFEKLLMAPEGKAYLEFTVADLENLLNGKPLRVRRKNFLKE